MAKRTADIGGGRGMATDTPTTSDLGNTGTFNSSGLGNEPGLNVGTDVNRPLQGQESHGVAQQAKDQAKGLASEAKDQVKQVAGQARDHVQELVGQQKDQAADKLGNIANALREAANKLNEGEQSGGFGRYADQAAQQVDKLSTYLRDNDLRGFVRDTETFARRRPDLFLGTTFLAGLMLARFLKASGTPQDTGYDGYDRQDWRRSPSTGTSAYGTGTSSYGSTYGTPGTENRSSYTPERRDPADLTGTGTTGNTSFNDPLGR